MELRKVLLGVVVAVAAVTLAAQDASRILGSRELGLLGRQLGKRRQLRWELGKRWELGLRRRTLPSLGWIIGKLWFVRRLVR